MQKNCRWTNIRAGYVAMKAGISSLSDIKIATATWNPTPSPTVDPDPEPAGAYFFQDP
jgi:hypothetical protein